jgi:hypothetical protein
MSRHQPSSLTRRAGIRAGMARGLAAMPDRAGRDAEPPGSAVITRSNAATGGSLPVSRTPRLDHLEGHWDGQAG